MLLLLLEIYLSLNICINFSLEHCTDVERKRYISYNRIYVLVIHFYEVGAPMEH